MGGGVYVVVGYGFGREVLGLDVIEVVFFEEVGGEGEIYGSLFIEERLDVNFELGEGYVGYYEGVEGLVVVIGGGE